MRSKYVSHFINRSAWYKESLSCLVPAASSAFISYRCFAASTQVSGNDARTIIFPREGPGVSYGLNWALASRGVIVKDKAFHNLRISDLHVQGATTVERLSGLPIYLRGSTGGGALDMPKSHFSKLLKQVASHLSSVSTLFVHDGAISSSPKCDVKVRVISDSPSAVLALSSVLWRTTARAVSHDSCPLIVYVATAISQEAGATAGLETQGKKGFIVSDMQHRSVILSGNAFADLDGLKGTLAAASASVLLCRGGLPLSARLLFSGDSVILVFAPGTAIQRCSRLQEFDTGIIFSSSGVAPLFRTRDLNTPNLYKLPASVIFISLDSSGTLPLISKLSPGQAAFHFLAGYQNGKFVPSYNKGPSGINLLELAKGLMLQLKDKSVPAFLLNINQREKSLTGDEIVKLIESTLGGSIRPLDSKGNIEEKYKEFMLTKFGELPEEFSF